MGGKSSIPHGGDFVAHVCVHEYYLFMNTDYQKEDKLLITSVAGAVAKSILYICITVAMCMWISTCNVSATTIEACKNSCKSFGSHMESVTSSKCVCASYSAISPTPDPWVIPRANSTTTK